MRFNARRFPRVELRAFAAVSAASNEDMYKEYNATCINISEGGCCLAMNVLLSGADIDFGMKIAIELPDNKPRLIAGGRIVWLKESPKDILTQYQVGVEFSSLNPRDLERIREFIQNQLDSK